MRLAWFGVLLLVPLAAGQGNVTPEEVETTLYFHMLNVQDMPINTQEPVEGDWTHRGEGLATYTAMCVQQGAGNPGPTQGMLGHSWHTYYGYSSASRVGYDFQQNGHPRTHPERGLGYDVPLLSNATMHWTMKATSGLNLGDAPIPGLPTSNVVVRAILRSGDAISIGDKSYNSGEILFQGETEPVTMAGTNVVGAGASQVSAEQVGSTLLYTFRVPLARQGDVLPVATGYNVRIDVVMDVPGCDPQTGSVMTNSLTPYADAQHWSRIVLTHGKPLDVPIAGVDQDNETLFLHWGVQSAWGAYDVDAANVTLRVLGPVAVQPELVAVVQRMHEHYHLTEPVRFAWALDATALPDGTYTALLEVPNLQGTATANSTLTFTVQDGQLVDALQQAPGPAFAGTVAALAALAFLVSRRR